MTDAAIICSQPEDVYMAAHKMSMASDPHIARAGRAFKAFGGPLHEWIIEEAARPDSDGADALWTAVKVVAQTIASGAAYNCPEGGEEAVQRALEMTFVNEMSRIFEAVAAAKQQGGSQ